MAEARAPSDETRRRLKAFGVAVTNYETRTGILLERLRAAGATDQEALLAEIAALTSDLHHALQAMTIHVLQVQSDVLMGVASATDS